MVSDPLFLPDRAKTDPLEKRHDIYQLCVMCSASLSDSQQSMIICSVECYNANEKPIKPIKWHSCMGPINNLPSILDAIVNMLINLTFTQEHGKSNYETKYFMTKI